MFKLNFENIMNKAQRMILLQEIQNTMINYFKTQHTNLIYTNNQWYKNALKPY